MLAALTSALSSACMAAVISGATDARMVETYNSLSKQLLRTMAERDQAGAPPLWVGIAGGPGAGKSTLAAAVAERVNAAAPGSCVVLPMDGFHYSRARLREIDPPDAANFLPRRGAPWTFDAEALCEALRDANRVGEASLPTYSRQLSDPVDGGVRLEHSHRCVLVEGNYLLLRDEPRWAALDDLWQERWFVKCASAEEQRRRLIARHLETWNEEKTARWGPGEAGAAARADANDVKNMELIAPCEQYADRVVQSL